MTLTNQELRDRFAPFISRRDADRHINIFWETQPSAFSEPGKQFIELSGGMPHTSFFPIESMSVNILTAPGSSDTINVPITHETPNSLALKHTLQYALSEGFQPLIDFVRAFVTRLGNVPQYDPSLWQCLIANGSCDSLFKIFQTCTDKRSVVLVEELTFVPVISNILATGAKVVPLKLSMRDDDQGIDTAYMEDLLANWETGPYAAYDRPKFLYTIPTGQNPTGLTQSVDKRRKIYALAQKYDFVILEDDPYGYLKFPKFNHEKPMENPYTSTDMTTEQYARDVLMTSYISMDTDGRVIRFETFSKIFAPGMRLSFVILNNFFYEKLLKFQEITTRQPTGISQQIVYSTIHAMAPTKNTDDVIEAWLHWIMKLACSYTDRRNVMLDALYNSEAYKQGLYSVVEPSAGMFIIVNVNVDEKRAPVIQQMDELIRVMDKHGVRAILGYKMAVDREFSRDHLNFFRLTYAYADNHEQLREAITRLSDSVVEYMA